MRYFTKDLWIEAQSSATGSGNPSKWDRAFEEYRAQLEKLRVRIPNAAFEFFAEADVHDGELLDLRVIDGSRPAPITERPRSWRSNIRFPVRVELTILDAYDKLIWTLSYGLLRRCPNRLPLRRSAFLFIWGWFRRLGVSRTYRCWRRVSSSRSLIRDRC